MRPKKSIAADKSDAGAKAEQTFVHSHGIALRRRMDDQMVQNVHLIWLDSNIDNNSTDCRNTITQLRHVVNTINTFTNGDECIQFLESMSNEKVCMIISGSLGERIVPHIHNMSQIDSIFIFCDNKELHEQWTKEWPKIKGIFTEISPIYEALKQGAQQCWLNAIPISFIATSGDISKKKLDQLDPSFMYTQIIKEILLTINFEEKHFTEYIDYCFDIFVDNEDELKNVEKLERDYHDQPPIWWYTYECFLYPMLNRALRLMDTDIIIKMGFFIDDLHRHIEQLHKEQFGDPQTTESFTVYRGEGMSKFRFEQMSKTKGGLISFNNFLSTSKDRTVSLSFANRAVTNPDLLGILFIMTIDPPEATTPFASIVDVSYYKDEEDEVLFAMHTVFRIGKIKPIGGNDRLFQVELILTNDNDKDLRLLTNRIREETEGATGWDQLGELLLKLGQSNKAEKVYEVLLKQATKESEKARVYHQLGKAKYYQGKYKEAIILNEKALEIRQQSLSPNHPDLAKSYNTIGEVYRSMGEYTEALSFHAKALDIREQSLPLNHSDLAKSYNNIGLVYDNMGEYPKALSSHEKALEIKEHALPSNHPDLGASYINIGNVYYNMGEYSKALSSYKKAHEIQQHSLLPDHSDLAMSCNNIGSVYYSMGEYTEALSSHEKALSIRRRSLPSSHLDLAMSYNNIGNVYYNMSEYWEALSSYQKAHEIQQQSLRPDHPDLSASYNNMGNVYFSMGEYSKTLSSYEKVYEIQEQSLPSNHPDLASTCYNIGLVYYNMGEYTEALSSYEKALEIQQQFLPPNHPDLILSYNNIGEVHLQMHEYLKALSVFKKTLDMQEQTLSLNHSDFTYTYRNIGLVYENMDDYLKAHSFYERAVDIGQQSLSSDHPELQKCKEYLDRVKAKLPLVICFFVEKMNKSKNL